MLCLVSRFAAAQGYTVSGTVTLEGCYSLAIPQQPITFFFASTDNPYSFTRATNLGADGSFTIPDVPADTYKLHIKGAKWLASVQTVNTTAGNVTGVTATLAAGDANNDNSIDSSDFGILIGAFNSDITISGSGYDPQADFTCDGLVDSQDFGLLIGEFNSMGLARPDPAIVVTNLTLSVTGVTAGASLTGTVTISSKNPTSDTTLMLSSSNPAVLLMPTVTIQAGATQSLPFTIATDVNAVSEPLTVTISASSGHWTQSASLSIRPANYVVSVDSLDVAAGNGCSMLTWQGLPAGAVAGYYVYRRRNGAVTRLTTSPLSDPLYIDSGLVNGVAYDYQVTAIDFNGAALATSAWINITPSNTIPQLNWLNQVANVTGMVELAIMSAAGDGASGVTLLVDGAIYSGAGVPSGTSTRPKGLYASLDSGDFSNGSHTVQMYGYIGDAVCVTPPMVIQINNDISAIESNALFDPSAEEVAPFSASLPANIDYWTVNVTSDLDGSAVTSWTGTTTNVSITWDGKNSSGADAADGTYSIELAAFRAGKPPIKTKKHKTLGRGAPQGLALVSSLGVEDTPDLITQYVAAIRSSFDAMHNTNGSFKGIVIHSIGMKPKDRQASMLKIRGWLQNTVQDFYYYGHGGDAVTVGVNQAPQFFQFGGTNFWPNYTSPAMRRRHNDAAKFKTLHFFINDLTANRDPQFGYNFVMIDDCNSSGNPDENRYDINTWYNGFNLDNTNYFSCFWGWYGLSGSLGFTDPVTQKPNGETAWSVWRKEFWLQLGVNGRLVITAGSNATTKGRQQPDWNLFIAPWDQLPDGHYRAGVNGNTFLP